MQSRTLLAATLVAAATATLVAASSGASTGHAQVRISDLQIGRRLVKPAGGGIAGSIELVRQRLYKPGVTNKPIGRSDVVCTYLRRPGALVHGHVLPPEGAR